jgi:hypothetical protein
MGSSVKYVDQQRAGGQALGASPLRSDGYALGAVDLDRGEVKVQGGRVLMDGHRTATDDPKSAPPRGPCQWKRSSPAARPSSGHLRPRQAADRLMRGAGYPETGLVRAGRRTGQACTS